MTFEEAKKFVIMYGPYIGKTIDKAARTDKGLLWLDRELGRIGNGGNDFGTALGVYLSNEAVERDLKYLLGE